MQKIRLCLGLLIIFTAVNSHISAQDYVLKHVEPPFWYTGLKHQQLQIMIHGSRIGELEPVFNYPGIETDSLVRVANPNYLFIYLKISTDAKSGSFRISLKKGSETKASYLYKLEPRVPGSASRKGFNNSDVIYLITPDRFAMVIHTTIIYRA